MTVNKDEIRKLLKDNDGSVFKALLAYEPPEDSEKKELTHERLLDIIKGLKSLSYSDTS